VPAYTCANTELGAIIGRSQLEALDHNVDLRTRNLQRFLVCASPPISTRPEFLLAAQHYAFKPDA